MLTERKADWMLVTLKNATPDFELLEKKCTEWESNINKKS